MENPPGVFYLIPSMLSPDTTHVMPAYITEIARGTRHFFVENERSARRFLKSLDKNIQIDELVFCEVDTHHPADTHQLKRWLQAGFKVGMISEAGYPCIADPGDELVREAHRIGARVIPLVGPNAMLMALAASGFNGQQFSFSGYLPVKSIDRIKALTALEKKALQSGETQIFMETPYRNNQLLQDILQHGQPSTMLCIAVDVTAPGEMIRTRSIKDWKQEIPDLHKRPAVFLINRP